MTTREQGIDSLTYFGPAYHFYSSVWNTVVFDPVPQFKVNESNLIFDIVCNEWVTIPSTRR